MVSTPTRAYLVFQRLLKRLAAMPKTLPFSSGIRPLVLAGSPCPRLMLPVAMGSITGESKGLSTKVPAVVGTATLSQTAWLHWLPPA